MKIDRPKLKIGEVEYEILSMEEFKQRIDYPGLSTPTIAYNMEHNKLDYTLIGHARYIIFNDKAKRFKEKFEQPEKKTERSKMTFSTTF